MTTGVPASTTLPFVAMLGVLWENDRPSAVDPTLTGVSVGESGLLQLPLADYQILAASAPNYPIHIPTLKTVVIGPLDEEGKKASVGLQGAVLQGPYTLRLSVNSSLTAPISLDINFDESKATLDLVLFDTDSSKVNTPWNTTFEVVGIQRVDGEYVVLWPNLAITTPTEPERLVSVSASDEFDDADKTTITLTFTSRALQPSTLYTLTFRSADKDGSTSHEKTVTLQTSGSGMLGPHSAILYPTAVEEEEMKRQFMFGTEYSLVSVKKGDEEILFEKDQISFVVPPEPIRIEGADCSLGGEKEKAGVVEFWGVGLANGKGYTLKVQKEENGVVSGEVIELNGTLSSGSESGSFLHTEEIFGASSPLLSYGATYLVVGIVVGGEEGVVNKDVGFSVPTEPARIVRCIERLLDGSNGTLTVRFEGRAFTSPLGLILLSNGTHNWPSLSPLSVDNTTHCSACFAVDVDESDTKLGFGKEYTLLGTEDGSTGCLLEDMTVTVPTPSVFTQMNIRFKNNLNTSCVVELAGRSLVVHNQYNLTLNNSVSVVVRISSPTEGQSDEVPIGWPGHLQFNEECVVTDIARLDGEDDTIIVDSVLSATTGLRPSHLNLFVSNDSADESVFCGEESRPCCSVDVAWKIVEGLAFDRPIFELVDSPWLNSSLSISSGMIVVFRNGTGTSPTLSVSSSAHPVSSLGAVVVHESAVLEVHNVDIEILSSDLSFVFISATLAKLVMKDGSLKGTTIQHGQNEEESDICSWTNGVLQLTNTTTTLSHQDLAYLSQGVVHMRSGTLTIEACLFHDNTPSLEPFPSFRRNLMCSDNGSIDLQSLSGGDGTLDHPSLWMAVDGCSMTGEYAKPLSPLFIPTLSNTSTSSFDKKKELYEIEVKGSTLIPCGLFLEVFEMTKDKKEGNADRHQLSTDTTSSFTETSITLALSASSLPSLDSTLEWRGRLVFGEELCTDEWFVVQKDASGRLAQSVRDNMKWWIPLVIVLSCAALLALIVVIVCVRRRKGKKDERLNPKVQEQELQQEDKIEVKEEEVVPLDNMNDRTRLTAFHAIETKDDFHRSDSAHKTETRVVDAEMLHCGESCEVVKARVADTLFNRLHKNGNDFDKRKAMKDLARGVSTLVEMKTESDVLRRLSPHVILVDEQNHVFLQLKVSETGTPFLENGSTDNREGERWRAPEVNAKTEGNEDGKAAVFSLGLILWEMETGLVPFGEVDAVNAQRQLETGHVPPMSKIKDKDFSALLVRCLSLNGVDRPSPKELDTFFSTHSFAPTVELSKPDIVLPH
ncbi:hypothetical protein BLNAU_3246 [Blattamonas nauphoetae]|uniref:Protein kinase domain-containing protein n=1 Tax=Blattamonas nauphoetae TaxID=2049346 RepID=A0ABQ9YDK1_9EUKA|nr:hypothetical protein BLNAU_3246 [Blattamonas nauphoetae]